VWRVLQSSGGFSIAPTESRYIERSDGARVLIEVGPSEVNVTRHPASPETNVLA
jgi:hypothetical protein